MRLKNIQTCFLLYLKIHILSVDIWKDRHGGEGNVLILTQWAQRHTISPNYRAREGQGASKITHKIKKKIGLRKIWSTSQNTQTFPTSTFLRYAVISYGWPFLSLSVRLLSALSAQLSKAPQPPDLTSLLHSLVQSPTPSPFLQQNPLPKPTVHTWQSLQATFLKRNIIPPIAALHEILIT